MNQWAARNPELASEGITYEEAHSDLADMREGGRFCNACNGSGYRHIGTAKQKPCPACKGTGKS